MGGLLSGGAELAAKRSRGLLSSGAGNSADNYVDPAGYWNQVGAWLPFGPGGGIAGHPMSAPPDRSGEARLLEFLAGSTPIVGEAMSARDFGRSGAEAFLLAQQGDYGGAARRLPALALSGLGMVPFLGGITREAGRLAPRVLRIQTATNPDLRVLINPTRQQLDAALAASKGKALRVMRDAPAGGGNMAAWDAYHGTHQDVGQGLGWEAYHDPGYWFGDE